MKPRNMYRTGIGALLIVSGMAVLLVTESGAIVGTMLLAAGCAFLVTGILRHRRYGDDPESDERSKKIGAYGLSYAWLTGLFFMTGLFWLDYLGIFTPGTGNALALSVLVLGFSAVIYQVYLFRKGDVE